jgi:hypothetical protein
MSRSRVLRAGRINVIGAVVVAGIVALLVMVMLSGEGPATAGGRFMVALEKGDVKTLVDMSYSDGISKEELQKKWEYGTQVVAPHYRFVYTVNGASETSNDTASLRMTLTRDVDNPSAFEEKFELPLKKKDGRWLVDVFSIDRRMYPGLPR